MYRFWDTIIEPLLDALHPEVIVEVGSDHGHNTRNLAQYCRAKGGQLHVIDPLPKYDVDEWSGEFSPHVQFHTTVSVIGLHEVPPPDVVLLDGDHNWHTVISELRILGERSEVFPWVLFHDVGWPYGRRDLYYEPERIPSFDRHPFAKKGLRPGSKGVAEEGGINAHLHNAVTEGGPRNGVLTAIEDYIAESPRRLELLTLPGVNGFGILYDVENSEVEGFPGDLLAALSQDGPLRDLLTIVESGRLDALTAVADGVVERAKLRDQMQARIAGLENEIKRREEDVRRTEEAVTRAEARHEADVSRMRSEIEEEQEKTRLAKKEAKSQAKKAAAARLRYDRLRSRRSVRLVLRLADLARPLFRSVRRAKAGTVDGAGSKSPGQVAGPDRRDMMRLVEEIRRRKPGSPAVEGPLVSIIVLTRDGAHHLRRLLTTLDQVTTYRSFEVLVVDNGSVDETADVLAEARGFPLRVLSNEGNTSFSAGNNQGAAAASGEYLLLMNNDVEPVNPGWLGAMVDAFAGKTPVSAVGAELVYPIREDPETDLTVQHWGIDFGFLNGAPRASNRTAPDPVAPMLDGLITVPAATAAVLMVRADTFREVGGFDEGYVYGTEDVDLCLKLRRHGRILVSGESVLFHHESATQALVEGAVTTLNRQANWARFAEVWGPRITRSVRRHALAGDGHVATARQPLLAITLSQDDPTQGWGDYFTAHELGDAFESLGWSVVYAERYEDHWYELGDDVDVVISLLESYDVTQAPQGAVKIAWVRNWLDRWVAKSWFDSYDMVVVASEVGAEAIARSSRFRPAVLTLATNPDRFSPGPVNPTLASDYVFTGSNWGGGRSIVPLLDIHPDERFRVFGGGWQDEPRLTRYWGGSLDYELLPDVYRSAKVVLDDASIHTLPHGFLNSRVFDSLAAGTLVLTNNHVGSEEFFAGRLPSYDGREDLRRLLDEYLADDERRAELASSLREEVLENHTYVKRAGQFVEQISAFIESPRVAIKIGVPTEELKPQWGDTHFAEALAGSLTAIGLPTEVHILPKWDAPTSQNADVVIHLRGLTTYSPKPGQLNVLWLLSHPDDVPPRECEKYDLVLVASKSHAEWLSGEVETPVVYLPQATDHRRFHPVEPRPDLVSELLFVGNSRNQRRVGVEWAIDRKLPLAVYGGGWDGMIPSRFVHAAGFPNDQLAHLYASAGVVLNDHWPDMREHGFISNRIFDALASGSVVVSDPVIGLEDIFGELVPTYSSPEELDAVVSGLLSDPDRRKLIGEEGSRLVAESHTFDHRARQILDLIAPLLAERDMDVDGGRFSLDSGVGGFVPTAADRPD